MLIEASSLGGWQYLIKPTTLYFTLKRKAKNIFVSTFFFYGGGARFLPSSKQNKNVYFNGEPDWSSSFGELLIQVDILLLVHTMMTFSIPFCNLGIKRIHCLMKKKHIFDLCLFFIFLNKFDYFKESLYKYLSTNLNNLSSSVFFQCLSKHFWLP